MESIDVAQIAALGSVDEVPTTLVPTQPVTDRIWQIIVWAFAIVLVGVVVALIAAIFWLDTVQQAEHIQILLTVFTTAAGILAGFISGRASSSGTSA